MTISNKTSKDIYLSPNKQQKRKLTDYNLFVKEQSAILRKDNIHIQGSGNTLRYIAKLWQQKKEIEKQSIIYDILQHDTSNNKSKIILKLLE